MKFTALYIEAILKKLKYFNNIERELRYSITKCDKIVNSVKILK